MVMIVRIWINQEEFEIVDSFKGLVTLITIKMVVKMVKATIDWILLF